MTEENARESYSQIVAIIKDTQIKWILGEVEEEIRRGKPQQRKVKVEKSENDLWAAEMDAQQEKRSVAKFTASIEYTQEERLELLIHALEQTTLEAANMEITTALALNAICKESNPDLPLITLEFRGEGESPSRRSTSEGRRELNNWHKEMSQLLEKIKEEIYAH
jgi:hypothetical protein